MNNEYTYTYKYICICDNVMIKISKEKMIEKLRYIE